MEILAKNKTQVLAQDASVNLAINQNVPLFNHRGYCHTW